jgi:hypothetical protein
LAGCYQNKSLENGFSDELLIGTTCRDEKDEENEEKIEEEEEEEEEDDDDELILNHVLESMTV